MINIINSTVNSICSFFIFDTTIAELFEPDDAVIFRSKNRNVFIEYSINLFKNKFDILLKEK